MISKLFKILYSLLILFFVISIIQTKKLPEKNEIVEDLYQAPVQSQTDRADFTFDYRDNSYHVKPAADYELWGLVVSVNNIHAWYNYYHDENTVNLKDVCVVWGKNIQNNIYKDSHTKYKSGEWTCYVQWRNVDGKTFYLDNFSNNHLLTADPQMQEIIRNTNVGDQIHIKGSLVDYAELGNAWYRKTSLSRTDSNQSSRSGGACEVLYVDKIDVIKENQPYWHLVKAWSKNIFIALLAINFFIFIFETSGSKSYFKKK